MAGFPTVFRLGAFLENIEGEVVNPENAIGGPGATFTGNASGSWTAKWQLETPESTAKIVPYTIKKLTLFCRRASTGGKDPVIRSVVVRDGDGQPVYEFVAGAQITNFAGPVALAEREIPLEWDNVLLEMTRGFDPVMHPQGSSGYEPIAVLGGFVDANNNLFVAMGATGTTRTRLFKVTGFGSPALAVASWTEGTAPLDAGGGGDSWMTASPDGSTVAMRVSTSAVFNALGVLQAWTEKEVEPGVFRLVPMSITVASGSAHTGFAFSETGEYLVVNTSSSITSELHRLLWLYKRDLDTNTYNDITPAPFTTTSTVTNSPGHLSWVGNKVARATRTGYFAWTWDSINETFIPITGVEGGQWTSTTATTGAAISPNGRWLAAMRGIPATTGDNEVWVEDLDNPGAANRRMIITPANCRLIKLVWSPDSQSVVFVARALSTSHSLSNLDRWGHPITLNVPESGALSWCADFSNDYPFTSQTPVRQISFSSSMLLASLYRFSGGSSQYWMNRSAVLRTTELNVDNIELAAAWEIPGKTVIWPFSAHLGGSIGLGPGHGAGYWDDMRVGERRYTWNNGAYFIATRQSGNDRQCGIVPWRGVTKVGRFPVTVTTFPQTESATAFTGVTVSKDGKYVSIGRALYEVTYTGGESWSVALVPDPDEYLISTSCNRPQFRHAPDGDPLPNLLFYYDGSLTPPTRFIEISSEGSLIYRDDLTIPNFDTTWAEINAVMWSHDGQYLFQYQPSGGVRVWRFTGTAFSQITLPALGLGSQRYMKWHPTENVLLVVSGSLLTSGYTVISFLKFEANTASLLDSSAFQAQLFAPRNGVWSLDWEANGKYIGATYAFNVEADGPPNPQQRHIWKWCTDSLVAGTTLDKLPDNLWGDTGGYGDNRTKLYQWYDEKYFGRVKMMDGRLTYAQAPNEMGLGNFIVQSDPSIIYEDLQYTSGWTVEIETFGDGNAVQLGAVELEVSLNLFVLATPTILPPVAVTGTSALVEWTWEPAP